MLVRSTDVKKNDPIDYYNHSFIIHEWLSSLMRDDFFEIELYFKDFNGMKYFTKNSPMEDHYCFGYKCIQIIIPNLTNTLNICPEILLNDKFLIQPKHFYHPDRLDPNLFNSINKQSIKNRDISNWNGNGWIKTSFRKAYPNSTAWCYLPPENLVPGGKWYEVNRFLGKVLKGFKIPSELKKLYDDTKIAEEQNKKVVHEIILHEIINKNNNTIMDVKNVYDIQTIIYEYMTLIPKNIYD